MQVSDLRGGVSVPCILEWKRYINLPNGGPSNIQIMLGNLAQRFRSCQTHGELKFALQVFEDCLHAHPAAQRKAVHDRPSDGDHIGAQRQGFEDVLSSAY